MSEIGFVLLTHSNPGQIARLVTRLSALYDRPPIALHHDFGRCQLDVSGFRNVFVVSPHLRTKWAHISLVHATLEGMKLLYQRSDPEWFVLLSGCDYPVKKPEMVLQDLRGSRYDAVIESRLIDPQNLRDEWVRECCDRYIYKTYWVPWLKGRHLDRRKIRISNRQVLSRITPFSERFHCFGGAHWFTARREVVRYTLSWTEANPWLLRHFANRVIPEEAYFQTVVANGPAFRLAEGEKAEAYRYIDWTGCISHPRWLELDDVPAILASAAHFARKFRPDSPPLDELDRTLGLG